MEYIRLFVVWLIISVLGFSLNLCSTIVNIGWVSGSSTLSTHRINTSSAVLLESGVLSLGECYVLDTQVGFYKC